MKSVQSESTTATLLKRSQKRSDVTIFVEESGQKNSQSTLEQIYILIKNNPSITRKQLVEATGKASSYIQRCINQLKETKRIQRVGGDKGGF